MKQFISKNAMALLALVIAAGSYGLMSFGNAEDPSTQTLHWYEVDPNTNQTVSAAMFNDTKENVLDEQDCQDDANQPICLYGSTNSSLPIGTPVGTPAPENRILQTEN